MKLTIDSTNNLETRIKLNEKLYLTEYESPREQNVLGAIQDAFAAEHIGFSDITEICINTGPGSFTGIRVGFSIAYALSTALSVDLTTTDGSTPMPKYGRPASITPSKS
jgi:tRNA threonylcarbamoyladenosine biosynthesis protein TsaB